ncbi:hypothetical protein BDA99DRAFT_92780 [Phascolomyces articulosus]|uniref:Uncharacterized protein n=1 Tax=Phascolomyces articulosus TaxID=60185 RepID=A0AAD5K773_9FUNG|nr:hypothetical protein BDA99DRAFT_92780 [Phascolomyces articulosus]
MNHNHMSHSKPKQNKPNTLLNFFPRTQSSSQINNTNRNNNRNVTLLSSFSTRQQQQEQSIVDLTDNNSDDDLIILDERPRSNNPKRGMRSNGFGSQSTQHSSQGFGSQGIQNQELSSMSKFKREPSYNFEQRQSPVFSSHTPSTSITGTNTAYSNTITNNRVVPVERKISQPSGMSLTDRPSSTASHPLRGAGMVSTQSSLPSGWVKTASTNSSSYTSSASSLKRPFSSTTSSSSSSFSSSSQPSTNKRHRDLPATFVTSTSALATLSGKSSRETIMKGFKSVSSTGKSYGPNSYTRQRNTPNKSTQNNRQYRPSLSEEQQKVFNMVVEERRSLFFTGSAGTGKSVLLRGT